jgi:anti-sigma B factor antagonist
MVEINSAHTEDIYMIKVVGEVDASSSIHLDQSINEGLKKSDKILVDCTQLEYISSAGLGVFMSYINDLEEQKTTLVLFGLSDKVRHVFQILGLDQLLKIEGTEEEARKAVHGI